MGSGCENTWAGRLVIGLQLASWCVVGVLLLQRGVTSIQDDVTASTRPPPPSPDQATLSHNNNNNNNSDVSLDARATPAKSDTSKVPAKSSPSDKRDALRADGGSGNSIASLAGDVDTSSVTTNQSSLVTVLIPTVQPLETTARKIATLQTPSNTHNVRVPPSLTSAPKRYHLTPSGAVMATIGSLMLIVGPAIVAVRCCESYSERRRFNKLTAHDRALHDGDLPPSYEEVEGRAPRYSMLFPEPPEEGEGEGEASMA